MPGERGYGTMREKRQGKLREALTAKAPDEPKKDEPVEDTEPETTDEMPKPERTRADDIAEEGFALVMKGGPHEGPEAENLAAENESTEDDEEFSALKERFPQAFALWEKSGGTASDKLHAFTAFLKSLGAKDIPEPTVASIVGE